MAKRKDFKQLLERTWEKPIVRDSFYIILFGILFLLFAFFLNFSNFFLSIVFEDSYILFGLIFFFSIYLSLSSGIFAYRRYKEKKEADYGRKRAEKQKEKSNQQLQAVLDGVPDIILQVDTFMRILWANKAALEYSPNAIGNISFDAFLYEKGTFIDTYCKWAMEAGQIEKGIQYQTNFLGKKSGTYWEIIGVPVKDKNNQIYGSIAIAREITNRMRIEHTWNLLSSVVESTDDAIYGVTLGGDVLSWNEGAINTYKYSASEMIGYSINLIVPALDRKELYRSIERVMRTEKIERYETERIRKDKTKIAVSTTVCPFVDATGRKVGVSIIERDITESKLYEQKLLESENFNKTIISSVKEGIAVFNSKFDLAMWNKSMEEITGITSSEVIKKSITELFPELIQEEIIEKLKNTLNGETEIVNDIFLRTPARKDGGWYNISFTPHVNTNNKIIGIIASFRDITQSKLADVALAYSEEKYRQLVENVSEAIANIAIDGTILFVNEVASTLIGMPSEMLIGRNAVDIVPNDLKKELSVGLNSLFALREKQIFDINIDTKTDERAFFISAQPVFSNSGDVMSVMCLITDITDRKKAEQELERSREALRNLAAHLESVREDERKEIAFEVHDELGQELTALKLDLSYIAMKINKSETLIHEKIKEMKGLIDITIDRVGSISTKLRPDILDHFGILAAIEWQTGDFQKRSGIECILVFEPEEMNVESNKATVIFRILQETLTNVIRHSKATSTEILFKEEDAQYILTVSDNGIGISEEKIKDPNSFGIFAMNERARSVGGKISINGTNNQGTIVQLTVPKDTEN